MRDKVKYFEFVASATDLRMTDTFICPFSTQSQLFPYEVVQGNYTREVRVCELSRIYE